MSSSPTITTATMNSFRLLPRAATRALRSTSLLSKSSFSTSPRLLNASSTRKPPEAPDAEAAALRKGNAPTYLGTTKRLPEFNLVDKVVLVSGAARGLGLVQAEALLEAGATGIFFSLRNITWVLRLTKDSVCSRQTGNAVQ